MGQSGEHDDQGIAHGLAYSSVKSTGLGEGCSFTEFITSCLLLSEETAARAFVPNDTSSSRVRKSRECTSDARSDNFLL